MERDTPRDWYHTVAIQAADERRRKLACASDGPAPIPTRAAPV